MQTPAAPQPELNRAIAQVCLQLIEAAKTRRKSFLTTGREIMRYGFSRDWAFEYNALSNQAWFKAKIPKTAVAFQVIVPSLIGPVPNRLVRAKNINDPALLARTEARGAYLNYTPQYTNFIDHVRRCHEECVGYGGGVMWTGLDERTGLVSSSFGSVRELLLDPNADLPDDAQVSFRERVRPKFELVAEYPQYRDQIMDMQCAAKRWSDEACSYEWDKADTRTDCVRYYECWFRTGIQNFRGGTDVVKAMQPGVSEQNVRAMSSDLDNTPVKYCVAEGGFLLSAEEWPVEFHRLPSQPWPWTMVKFYNQPGSPYPVSMLQPGLEYQRAMNHLVTLIMGKARRCLKTTFAIKKQGRSGLSTSQKAKIFGPLAGADEEYIEVELTEPNQTLKSFVEQFDWNMEWLNSTMQLFNLYDGEFQKATGLFDYLSTGMSQTQSRTAEDASNRERNSRTRLEDQRDMVAKFHTEVARKEAFAAATLLTREDVAKVIPMAAQGWGFLGDEEAKDPNYWMQQFSTKFSQVDPRMIQQEAIAQAAQCYTLDEIVYGTDFSIEAGSIRRKDIDQQLALLKEEKNTVVPLQLQSMDLNEKALGYDTLAEDARLQGLSEEIIQGRKNYAATLRQQAQMLAMMPPQPMPAEEPKK